MSEHELRKNQKQNHARASDKTRWIAKTGILSAAAIILMYLEFNIPLMPVFLKFDFAEVVALLGAFAMGPWTGLIIEFLKNLSHLPFSHTSYIGELANFIVCGSFVFVAGLIYQKNKTKKGAIVSLIVGTITMTIFGVLVNYYINLPFYSKVMGLDIDAIVGMTQAVGNTLVKDLRSLIVFVFVPFNIFKGTVISVIVMLIYKKVSPLLH
ncbi:MAG TPA: ECF transporter S component [Candidatus Eisenbacteria bacterium]|nr:ECF transporter S component [Candidatus Eisenbacteria bacterium]